MGIANKYCIPLGHWFVIWCVQEKERSTIKILREEAMLKKILFFLPILFILATIISPAYADQTVYGPEDCEIKRLHLHLSFHKFNVDDPGEGLTAVTKNTPEKRI